MDGGVAGGGLWEERGDTMGSLYGVQAFWSVGDVTGS